MPDGYDGQDFGNMFDPFGSIEDDPRYAQFGKSLDLAKQAGGFGVSQDQSAAATPGIVGGKGRDWKKILGSAAQNASIGLMSQNTPGGNIAAGIAMLADYLKNRNKQSMIMYKKGGRVFQGEDSDKLKAPKKSAPAKKAKATPAPAPMMNGPMPPMGGPMPPMPKQAKYVRANVARMAKGGLVRGTGAAIRGVGGKSFC